MERIAMNITGMSCGHCVAAVKQALAGVAGVQVEDVSVGKAVLTYDPAAVQPSAIEEAIAEEGYTVTSVEAAA